MNAHYVTIPNYIIVSDIFLPVMFKIFIISPLQSKSFIKIIIKMLVGNSKC